MIEGDKVAMGDPPLGKTLQSWETGTSQSQPISAQISTCCLISLASREIGTVRILSEFDVC